MFEDDEAVFGITCEQPWQDTMQVCLDGHVINDRSVKNPEHNRDFCNNCGRQTITNCPHPKCGKPIPGCSHGPNYSIHVSSAPDFCGYCGEVFPWTRDAEAKQLKEEAEKPIDALQRVFSKFHLIARKLRDRYDDRKTLDVDDEYDVQDLLDALLVLYFDDIRSEEWTPSYAGKSARMDFLLKKEKIVVETKMTRKGLADKEIGDQLIVDIERYKGHPDCDTLICFIYDPEERIVNPYALREDLQRQSKDDLKVIIVVAPS